MAKKKQVKSVSKEVIRKEIEAGICPICKKALVDGNIITINDANLNGEGIRICKGHRLILG